MNSRVHPKYKTKYRVTNWAEYERGLIQPGGVSVWLSRYAIAAYKPPGNRRLGGQRKFSDLATETALTPRLSFHSTGLSIVGQGGCAAAKHAGKGKRGWKKLHLGVDRSGAIVAHVLTDGTADDAKTGLELIEAVEGDITIVVGAAAYDTVAVYDAAVAGGAKGIVPPTRTAAVGRRRPRSVARDRTIERVDEIGRRRWKKESGYHQQGTVENAFFRYKMIVGGRLRAPQSDAQAAEATLARNVLNRMYEIGRSASSAISR